MGQFPVVWYCCSKYDCAIKSSLVLSSIQLSYKLQKKIIFTRVIKFIFKKMHVSASLHEAEQ